MYWNLTDKERFLEALNLADSPKLREELLTDLMSEKEFKDCILRLKVMCMLNDGATWKQIQGITGMSSRTIMHLNRKVRNPDGGFRKILKKFKKLGPAYFD
jgi:uncharacterized protein YerC